MKTKLQIKQKVEATFKALDVIEEVKVSHFFKHKILQKIHAEKEVKQAVFSWFTPQLATLSVLLLLNFGTIFYAFSNSTDNSNSSLETFAQEYSLQTNSNSILN